VRIASTFNQGKGRRVQNGRNPVHTQDQKTINRMTTTRRLGRLKVRMPEFKCLKDDNERG
jgi:hypothetical protein